MGKKIIISGVLIAIILFAIITYLSFVNYDYQLDKCINLDSSQSNYNFDLKLEIDAGFNEYCYYLNEHPLAEFGEVWLGGIMAFIAIIGVTFFVSDVQDNFGNFN